MISLERLNEMYQEELQKVIDAGIPLPLKQMPKTISTMKASSKFGDCYWERETKEGKIGIRIRVSEYHLPNGEDAVRETIAHEIIHAAPGRGHDKTWRQWADILNKKYGYHISRLGTYNAGYRLQSLTPKAVHKVVCLECGYSYNRTRHSNLTLHPERYTCGRCGGKLKLEY